MCASCLHPRGLVARSGAMAALALFLCAASVHSQAPAPAELDPNGRPASPGVLAELHGEIDREAARLEGRVIEWRRHFYQNPELSNREFETAATIAAVLRDLGLEVRTGVAHTGVVGILETGRPGPTVALRADMDALPVEDRSGVVFASKATGEYRGREVPVMHACGHDTHLAMLLGAAQILTGMRDRLSGRVVFIFQPAEEGAPEDEEGGAELMVTEGVLRDPAVDAIFGIHISSDTPVGTIEYRPGGIMAAADRFEITVHGKQTHGSTPWTGVDPIVTAAQIINGLQTVVSRRTELTKEAAVVSVGIIEAGVRNNIIPEQAVMIGTIRTLDEAMQEKIHDDIRQTATLIAQSMGATADVVIRRGVPVTYNDVELTGRMLPTLQAAAGEDNVVHIDAITGAEDFSFFQREVPGLYVFVGGLTEGVAREDAPPHHTPTFRIDEAGLMLGVRAYAYFAVDYLLDGATTGP
jgi:amidohydrolase